MEKTKLSRTKKVVFSGVVFVVFLLFTEISMQLYRYLSPQKLSQTTSAKEYLAKAHHPNTKFHHVKSEFSPIIVQNSLGAHDIEHKWEKPNNCIRIVILGDSFVEAHQVALEKTFFRKLEQKLNTNSRQYYYEIIALGMSGYGPEKEYQLLRNLALNYQPDLVLLFFLEGNDIRDVSPYLMQRTRQWQELMDSLKKMRHKAKFSAPLSKHSLLLQFIGEKIGIMSTRHIHSLNSQVKIRETIPPDYFVYEKPYNQFWQAAWNDTKGYINLMSNLCQINNTKFAIVSLGGRAKIYQQNPATQYPQIKKFTLDLAKVEHNLSQFCSNNKIPLYLLSKDMENDYPKIQQRWHWLHDGHWNEEGHKYVSEKLAQWLLRKNILPHKAFIKNINHKIYDSQQLKNILELPLSFNPLLEENISLPIKTSEHLQIGMRLLWNTVIVTPDISFLPGKYQLVFKVNGISAGKSHPKLYVFLLNKDKILKYKASKLEFPKTTPGLFQYNFLKHSELYKKNWEFLQREGLLVMASTIYSYTKHQAVFSDIWNIDKSTNILICIAFLHDGRGYYADGSIKDRGVSLRGVYLKKIRD